MLDLISSAKNTEWLSFPTLYSKYTYSHVANEAVDFQVIPSKNCFAQFNKKFGFELLRTQIKDNKDVIQRIKKRQVDDLSCGTISKVTGTEIAIGQTTGFIRIYSVATGDRIPHKFKPNQIGNSVVGLDFSNTDEYLAAVYDNSDINLFGLKTGVKIDTFQFEGYSTLVRFHPARKFALAIGSYEGGITMLDIQSKKKLFFEKAAHDAPLRDISMFESQDVFVSCGYDCKITMFDLRRRGIVQQYSQAHPMSTVCVSSCGQFCVAGNLKGDVISYDFRSMKEPLDTKRIHDSAVVRVAFVPSVTSGSNVTLNSTKLDVSDSLYKSSASHLSNGSDSFRKFVDICHYNNVAGAETGTPKRRDSWADLMPTTKSHDFSTDSMLQTPSRMSVGQDSGSELRLKRSSLASINQFVHKFGDSQEILIEKAEIDGKENLLDKMLPLSESNHDNLIRKRHSTFHESFSDHSKNSNSNTSPPNDFRSTKEPLDTKRTDNGAACGSNINSDHKTYNSQETAETAGKENPLDKLFPLSTSDNGNSIRGKKRRSTFHELFSMHIKNSNTSSPTYNPDTQSNLGQGSVAAVANANDLRTMLNRVVDRKINRHRSNVSANMKTALDDAKGQVDQNIGTTTNDMKDILQHFYSLGLKGEDNLMDRLNERFDLLENALCDLLERDQYAFNYFRMKFEIIDLKKKLGIRDPSILEYLH